MAAPRTDDEPTAKQGGLLRAIGTGVITGAADDDPSAIGTYASAGAKFGLSFLWIAPVLLPMMYVVVYLSAKLGRVYGKGLFAVDPPQLRREVDNNIHHRQGDRSGEDTAELH